MLDRACVKPTMVTRDARSGVPAVPSFGPCLVEEDRAFSAPIIDHLMPNVVRLGPLSIAASTSFVSALTQRAQCIGPPSWCRWQASCSSMSPMHFLAPMCPRCSLSSRGKAPSPRAVSGMTCRRPSMAPVVTQSPSATPTCRVTKRLFLRLLQNSPRPRSGARVSALTQSQRL